MKKGRCSVTPVIWTTRDGRQIPSDMLETSHLRNIVAMLRGKGYVTEQEFLACLAYACSGSTPDGAAMAAEAELDRMKIFPKLEALEAELAKPWRKS